MTAEVIPGATVTPAVARAIIDQARKKDYRHGVLGLRARPDASQAMTFVDQGQPVRIAPAASALAVRQAIRDADPDGWLVIVTDRSDDDLGAGLLAQFTWQRLRHPDPWQAVQQRFSAYSIDTRLLRLPQAREVAAGLLELAPATGWSPAPAGVLTRDHALGCVARAELGLPDGPVDLIAVLQWSTARGLPAAIARLRTRAGDATADAVLDWIAEASGEASPLVAALLRAGNPTDLVPLGVVLDCLLRAPSRTEAEIALARLEHRWGSVPRGALQAAGRLSAFVVAGMLGGRSSDEARLLLVRADELVTEAQAQPLAGTSTLLGSGLTQRLHDLADALRRVPDGPQPDIETAWARVTEHELSPTDPRLRAATAGVRLARWLHEPDASGSCLGDLAARHLHVDAWVDSAVNDADSGVDDQQLAPALERVLTAVQSRRDGHDLAFAAALAREGCDGPVPGVVLLEDALPTLTDTIRRYPTLLLVLDGLSAGVATEILGHVTSALEFGMLECLLPGATTRTPALAVLPTLTEASRASLLSGRLNSGQQQAEVRGFEEFAHGRGFQAKLIHKRGLDTSRPGFELADETRQAILATDQWQLVACVLNTIDDALDRTDPGGTDWSADTVKHLTPLLRAAQAAGRLVVITGDHGHVVERRRGIQRGVGLSGRHRAASGEPQPDEVLVAGPRVLTPDHRAILAASERLRYGPLKAGYHGGATPAEAVVPLVLLAPFSLTHTLRAAPVPEPGWWDAVVSAPAPYVETSVAAAAQQPDLFSVPAAARPGARGLGDALLGSTAFKQQKKLAGRLGLEDASVAALVDALASAASHQLPATRVAALLGVPVNRVPMVMSQVAQLLNVEGYPVVSTDPATRAVALDAGLLTEQYGVVL